jgi:hypothetical protein
MQSVHQAMLWMRPATVNPAQRATIALGPMQQLYRVAQASPLSLLVLEALNNVVSENFSKREQLHEAV